VRGGRTKEGIGTDEGCASAKTGKLIGNSGKEHARGRPEKRKALWSEGKRKKELFFSQRWSRGGRLSQEGRSKGHGGESVSGHKKEGKRNQVSLGRNNEEKHNKEEKK